MSWFRWKKRGEEAPTEAAAPEAPDRAGAGSAGIPPRRLSDKPAAPAPRKPRRPRPHEEARARVRGRGEARSRSPTLPRPKRAQRKSAVKPERERRRSPARKPAAAPPKIVLPDVKKEIFVSVEVGEQTVAVLEDGKPAEVYLGRPERTARSPATSTRASSTTSSRAWRRRSSTSASSATGSSTWTRSSSPSWRASATASASRS